MSLYCLLKVSPSQSLTCLGEKIHGRKGETWEKLWHEYPDHSNLCVDFSLTSKPYENPIHLATTMKYFFQQRNKGTPRNQVVTSDKEELTVE